MGNLCFSGAFLRANSLILNRTWKQLFVDGHWETKYRWKRVSSILLGESTVTITWNIPDWVSPGTYRHNNDTSVNNLARICHYGDKKGVSGKITPYTGISNSFEVF